MTKSKVHALLKTFSGRETFVEALEKVYEEESTILSPKLLRDKIKLSSGTSDVKCYPDYLKIITNSILSHSHYRKYGPPAGSIKARISLALTENLKFSDETVYSYKDFCITEGATGAISAFFEYFKENFPDGEVLIPVPSYYLFKLSVQQHNLKYREVSPILENKGSDKFLRITSARNIINSIGEKTKLIIITQPDNPTGEIYSCEEIAKIISVAKRKGILLLFDELFCDLILSKKSNFVHSDRIAYDQSYLNNIICVKAYSKNRNIPGFRIGYIFSKNLKIIERITKIQEERVFFATGSNFEELIILESFNTSVSQYLKKHPGFSLFKAVSSIREKFISERVPIYKSSDYLTKEYLRFESYTHGVLDFYSKNLSVVKRALKDESIFSMTESAFNTFVKIKMPQKVNMFDYCLNLFVTKGVKIQPGPYFGLSQKDWEDNFGLWIRISFSSEPLLMKEGLEYLIDFNRFYKSSVLINTGMRFK
ncbi:MAG: pyridoxal phosphate-dependent aminotransferase [Candidatus Curtissbacteria bacterium]